MPCHHSLAGMLRFYTEAAGIAEDRTGFLFRTSRGHKATALSQQPMTQPDAWRMIRRRAVAAAFMRRSAITVFGQPASRPISPTAVPSNTRKKWRHTKVAKAL
jgi:hypothetical protein